MHLIQNNLKKAILYEDIKLAPGVNKIDEKAFSLLGGNNFKRLFDSGFIQVLSSKKEKEASYLGHLQDFEAIKAIKDTYDLKLLEAYKIKESRESIIDAVNTQVQYVKDAINKERED
jgi:hypothetical protein